MEDVTLANMTEDLRLNAVLYGFFGLVELSFPGRVLAGYLLGSHSSHEAVSASDVDVVLVFRGHFQPGERERFEFFRRYLGSLSRMPLDVSANEEARLLTEGAGHLKASSLLLVGEDLRERIPLLSPDRWLRLVMHRPFTFIERSRSRAEDAPLPFPLPFPDATGALYGYDHRPHVEADGSHHPGLKDLVTGAGWIATALLALRSGEYAFSKSAAVRAYREHVNDPWASLFEDIHACRQRWGYRVPDSAEAQAHVRALCARMLEAENHFLALYEDFLLAELDRGEPEDRLLAARRLGLIRYPGPRATLALRRLADRAEEPLRHEARQSLARLA